MNTIVTNSPRLILASASKGRQGLLDLVGLKAEIAPADIDETPLKGELPGPHALRLAKEKAATIHGQNPGAYVMGADSVVACGRRILGKPKDVSDARRMLTLLSGRRHRLYTGLCVVAPDGKPRFRLVQTHVTFKRLSCEELDWYLDSGEWQGVCGAYKIQGKASFFMTSIQGTPSNIIGLPLSDLYALLIGTGFPLLKG